MNEPKMRVWREDTTPEQKIETLEQENIQLNHQVAELNQMLMIQKRSADLKVKCLETAVNVPGATYESFADVTSAADHFFKYVTGQV